MKQLLLVLTLLFTNVLYVASQDFRSSKWGDTKEQVIASEKTKPNVVKDDGVFYMDKTVVNKPCDYYYDLKEGVLRSGIYMIKSKFIDDNDYISEYESLKKSLTAKYGDPFRDKVDWKDNTFKSNPTYYGRAVAYGHVNYECRWITNRTIVVLSLSKNGFTPQNVIAYLDRSYDFKPNTEGL